MTVLFETLKIDQLKEFWVKQALVNLFNLLHNLGPPILSSSIKFNTDVGYTPFVMLTHKLLFQNLTQIFYNVAHYIMHQSFLIHCPTISD